MAARWVAVAILAMAGLGFWSGRQDWGWAGVSLGLGGLLIAWPGMRLAIWHARVPFAFTVTGVAALTVPEQVRHMIAGTEGAVQFILLAAAVFLLGVVCWFWGRWSLNLARDAALLPPGPATGRRRPGHEPSRSWAWLPRLLALAPAIAALIAILSSRDLMRDGQLLVLAALVLGVAVALFALAWRRRRHAGQVLKPSLWNRVMLHDELWPWTGGRPSGWRGWARLAWASAPLTPWAPAVLALLTLAVSVLVWTGAGPMLWWSQTVGPLPNALAGMSGLMTLLAPAAGLMAAQRWPALLLLGLWVAGSAAANINTAIRVSGEMARPPQRPSLAEAAREWLESCAEPATGNRVRVVLAGASGGASRAALWSAAVLRELEQQGVDPARHLFAVSGVSGGALGAAGYVASLAEAGIGCGTPAEGGAAKPAPARFDRLHQALGADFLSPTLAGLFSGDAMWRILGPVSAALTSAGIVPLERTQWLERSWEGALGEQGIPMNRGLAASTFGAEHPSRPRLPLLFTTGTRIEDGRLVLTAPVADPLRDEAGQPRDCGRHATGCAAIPGAVDAMRALGSDLPFTVAVSNSARFPYVTAPGLLRGPDAGAPDQGQVVDGGYADNLGTGALAAAIRALDAAHRDLRVTAGHRLQGTTLHVFVVQAWSDPGRVLRNADGTSRVLVPRCGVAVPAPTLVEPPSPLDFLLSPFGALVKVRGEASVSGAAFLREGFCGQQEGRDYFAFTLGPDAGGRSAPLNWVLPEAARGSILEAGLAGFPCSGNQTERARFLAAWNGQEAPEPRPPEPGCATPP
ncbi:hypothetical protein [Teichococcus oryzae]|uniref:PNPLA domain-containing protein n=1 Tax=Teichococcus oryzae TaxID=1608942 RepID=A0A5B2TGN1_9PROT|nr:hypothetical protein [Pseudoroseomonas oryzae]KAA2213651.1 hypothetical protein F0Q34_06140 [Pseudoroseomonas oryzae]